MDLKRILNPNLTLKQKDELGGGVAVAGGQPMEPFICSSSQCSHVEQILFS